METINVIIAVSGLLLTVLIALIPYFRKVYFIGPELTIELESDGGMSKSRGMSPKNDTSKGYIDGNNAIHVFELTYNVNLIITNNSNITAYYPKLDFLNQQLSFTSLDKLDYNTPIKGDEKIKLKGKYTMFEEATGKQRTKIRGLPDNFKDLKILLEYKNPYKKQFFTIFSNSTNPSRNKYIRRKPKEFK